MGRKSTGKRLRFEIFKRDGFRCVYCGATPMQKVLRIDHVVPVAGGGPSDPANLVTACHDCNAGKGARPLGQSMVIADGGVDEQRERLSQIRRFLALTHKIEEVRRTEVDALRVVWIKAMGSIEPSLSARFPSLLREWSQELLADAIGITEAAFLRGKASSESACARYFQGILRNWRTEGKR